MKILLKKLVVLLLIPSLWAEAVRAEGFKHRSMAGAAREPLFTQQAVSVPVGSCPRSPSAKSAEQLLSRVEALREQENGDVHPLELLKGIALGRSYAEIGKNCAGVASKIAAALGLSGDAPHLRWGSIYYRLMAFAYEYHPGRSDQRIVSFPKKDLKPLLDALETCGDRLQFAKREKKYFKALRQGLSDKTIAARHGMVYGNLLSRLPQMQRKLEEDEIAQPLARKLGLHLTVRMAAVLLNVYRPNRLITGAEGKGRMLAAPINPAVLAAIRSHRKPSMAAIQSILPLAFDLRENSPEWIRFFEETLHIPAPTVSRGVLSADKDPRYGLVLEIRSAPLDEPSSRYLAADTIGRRLLPLPPDDPHGLSGLMLPGRTVNILRYLFGYGPVDLDKLSFHVYSRELNGFLCKQISWFQWVGDGWRNSYLSLPSVYAQETITADLSDLNQSSDRKVVTFRENDTGKPVMTVTINLRDDHVEMYTDYAGAYRDWTVRGARIKAGQDLRDFVDGQRTQPPDLGPIQVMDYGNVFGISVLRKPIHLPPGDYKEVQLKFYRSAEERRVLGVWRWPADLTKAPLAAAQWINNRWQPFPPHQIPAIKAFIEPSGIPAPAGNNSRGRLLGRSGNVPFAPRAAARQAA